MHQPEETISETTESEDTTSPSELSKEVAVEIQDDFPEKDAEEIKERVHLKSISTDNPRDAGIFASIRKKGNWIKDGLVKCGSLIGRKCINIATDVASNLEDIVRNEKSIYTEITDVTPTGNQVQITVKHPLRDTCYYFTLEGDSTELSNLVRYVSAETPADLEGKHIPLKGISEHNSRENTETMLVIPKNISLSSRTRFNAFTIVNNLRANIDYNLDMTVDDVHGLILGLAITGFISIIPQLLFDNISNSLTKIAIISVLTMPFLVLGFLTLTLLGYVTIHTILAFIVLILRGPRTEIKAQREW